MSTPLPFYKRTLALGALAITLMSTVSGCVERHYVVARPRGCPGAVWVPAHRGPAGHWHHGHWACRRVVVVG